jgi:hypothetical protein
MSRSTARVAKLRSKFPEAPTEHHAAMQLGSFEKAAARSQALGDRNSTGPTSCSAASALEGGWLLKLLASRNDPRPAAANHHGTEGT